MEWMSDEKLDYQGHFGLEREPFEEHARGTAFFQDALISQRLGMLQHFSRYSDLMLLVTGEFGSGKSALMRHFIEQLDEDILASQVSANPDMGREAMLLALGKGFGMPPILDGDLDAFIKQLQGLLGSEEAGLLVIDDAHLLPADTLIYVMELAEIRGRQGKLLRVLLFAEPSIEQLLAEPSLARLGERISHNLDIPAMEPDRCEAYILHRLASAGHDGAPIFNKATLRRICKASRGYPLRINELATEALLEAVNRPQDEGAPVRRAYTIAIVSGLVLAILATLYFYRGEIFPRQAVEASINGNRTVVLPLNGLGDSDTPAPKLKGWEEAADSDAKQATAAIEETVETQGRDMENPPAVVAEEPVADTSAPVEPVDEGAETEASAGPRIKEVVPNPVVGSSRRQVITIKGSGFHPKAKLSVGWTGKAITLKPWQVTVVSAEEISFRVITGTQADTWTVRVNNPDKLGSNVYSFSVVAPQDPSRQQTVVPKTQVVSDEWLQARRPQNYTIQILASRSPAAVSAFAKQHQLSQGHEIQLLKDGQRWNYLVYGDYSSRVEADTMALQLAAALPEPKPWVRSFASLQQLMLQGQLKGAEWIATQPDTAFGLQLVAGGSRETIEAFVGVHQLTGSAAVYQTQRQGKAWYVLVYGVYADQAAAQAALVQLPESVRKLKPWARSYSAIKAELQ